MVAPITEQSSLGATLLAPLYGERIGKDTLNIVCFLISLAWKPHPASLPLCGRKQRKQHLVFGTCNVRTLMDTEHSERPGR